MKYLLLLGYFAIYSSYSQSNDTIPEQLIRYSSDSCLYFFEGSPYNGNSKTEDGYNKYVYGRLIEKFTSITYKVNDTLEIKSEKLVVDDRFYYIYSTSFNIKTGEVFKSESILGYDEDDTPHCYDSKAFKNIFGGNYIVYRAIYDGKGNLFGVTYENEKDEHRILKETDDEK